MGEMKTVVVEMKQNMDNVVFVINEIKYTFPIPETIKKFLRFGFLNNKIFFKMFYKDDTDNIQFMIMQYTNKKGNVLFEEKDWRL